MFRKVFVFFSMSMYSPSNKLVGVTMTLPLWTQACECFWKSKQIPAHGNWRTVVSVLEAWLLQQSWPWKLSRDSMAGEKELTNWQRDELTVWLTDGQVAWLAGWLTDRLTDCPPVCLSDWLRDRRTDGQAELGVATWKAVPSKLNYTSWKWKSIFYCRRTTKYNESASTKTTVNTVEHRCTH